MAERSKAPVSGTGHLWRGFESHYCHVSFYHFSWNEREREEKDMQQQPPPLVLFLLLDKPFVLAVQRHTRPSERICHRVSIRESLSLFCEPRAREREKTNKVNNNISSRVAVGRFVAFLVELFVRFFFRN